ncbi:hypothetical protein GO283_04562 [Ralstonia solanacearum]|nr:hypothetical protein [Ralstonia solanacearum]NKA74386.1 hypothetical protein [Ralstonia solanacearum]NKA95990.1 hypothetical protein [Ralstonia solanacearum]NKF87883.1 hypothetical protein [Ralstonia solanacearum]NKF96444.1 hypothetical protein [Ralstonia solanacearum]
MILRSDLRSETSWVQQYCCIQGRCVNASRDGARVWQSGGELGSASARARKGAISHRICCLLRCPAQPAQPIKQGWAARLGSRKPSNGAGLRGVCLTSQPKVLNPLAYARGRERERACADAYARKLVGQVGWLVKLKPHKALQCPTLLPNHAVKGWVLLLSRSVWVLRSPHREVGNAQRCCSHVRLVVTSRDGALEGVFGGEPSNLDQPTRKGWTARLDGCKRSVGAGSREIRPTSQPKTPNSHVCVRGREREHARAHAHTKKQVGQVRRLDGVKPDKALRPSNLPSNLARGW